LQAQCEDFQRARGIETEFAASISDDDASEQAAICLYRVLQESLMNVAKHSGSARAYVALTRKDNYLELRIRDAGHGFNVDAEARHGIGLLNMEERVRLLDGKMVVNSNPGGGTEVVVTVPATSHTRAHRAS
jgi:signal transduction histidine kinase